MATVTASGALVNEFRAVDRPADPRVRNTPIPRGIVYSRATTSVLAQTAGNRTSVLQIGSLPDTWCYRPVSLNIGIVGGGATELFADDGVMTVTGAEPDGSATTRLYPIYSPGGIVENTDVAIRAWTLRAPIADLWRPPTGGAVNIIIYTEQPDGNADSSTMYTTFALLYYDIAQWETMGPLTAIPVLAN